MAKDTYYFSHDTNARNDPKILSMRLDYGLKGYGMYWTIVETMREQDEYMLEDTNNTYRALAMQMQCNIEEVETFIKKCVNEYTLFKIADGNIYSDSLLKRMELKDIIKEKRKDAANKRWEKEKKNANAMQMDSNSSADELQDYAKERKGKERKEKKDIYIEFVELTKSEYEKLIEKFGEIEILNLIERLNNYIGSTGKKYKSHYHTILTWSRNEEKPKPKPLGLIGAVASKNNLGKRDD